MWKLFRNLAIITMALALDAALVTNFFWPGNAAEVYCERYILFYQILLWAIVPLYGILILLLCYEGSKDISERNAKFILSMRPKLLHRIERYVHTVPLAIFAGIFAGRTGLFIALLVLITMKSFAEFIAKDAELPGEDPQQEAEEAERRAQETEAKRMAEELAKRNFGKFFGVRD